MIRQFFRQAWTMMKQHKLFTGMYIAGTAISVAMAMAVFISLYVKLAPLYPEYNRNRMVDIPMIFVESDGDRYFSMASTQLREKIKEEAKHLDEICVHEAQYNTGTIITAVKTGIEIEETPQRTDNKFWKVFNFKFIHGGPFTQNAPLAVITSSFAKKLFATDNVCGEEIFIDTVCYKIAGVVEDQKTYMTSQHTDGNIWIPMNYNPQVKGVDNGVTGNEYIVMLAKSPEAKDSLKAEVKNIFERVVQQNSGNNKFKIIIMEHWEHALYMYNIYLNEENKENNFLAAIQKYLYAILAFLFIPAINLSGMISTRMSSRMDEVGVRKAYGATDRQIVSQVLWENLLLTLVGAIIGLALSYVTICSGHRWLMTILDTRIHTAPVSGITAEMLFNPTVVTMVLLVTFVLNIASALIPTLLALRNNIIESLYQRR